MGVKSSGAVHFVGEDDQVVLDAGDHRWRSRIAGDEDFCREEIVPDAACFPIRVPCDKVGARIAGEP